MKMLLGLLLLVGGAVLGIWLGIFVMFIGGIVQFINAVKVSPIDTMGIAVGLAKFFFAGAVGWFSAFLVAGTGIALMQND